MSKRVRGISSGNDVNVIVDVLYCLEDAKKQAVTIAKHADIVYNALHVLHEHAQSNNIMNQLLVYEKRMGFQFFHAAKIHWRTYCSLTECERMHRVACSVNVLCDDVEMLFCYVEDLDLRICQALFSAVPATAQFVDKLKTYADSCERTCMRNGCLTPSHDAAVDFFTPLLKYIDFLLCNSKKQ